ncbi:MAG: hypothetical protein V2G33_01615 [bacterium JZ-2024 1]
MMNQPVLFSSGYYIGKSFEDYSPEWGRERRKTFFEGFCADAKKVKEEGAGWIILGNLFVEDTVSEKELREIFSILEDVGKPIRIVPGKTDPVGEGSPYVCWDLPENVGILGLEPEGEEFLGKRVRGFPSSDVVIPSTGIQDEEVWIFSFVPEFSLTIAEGMTQVYGNSETSQIVSRSPLMVHLTSPFRQKPSVEPFYSSLWWDWANGEMQFLPGEKRKWISEDISFATPVGWKEMHSRLKHFLSSYEGEDFVEIHLTGFHKESLLSEDYREILIAPSPRVLIRIHTSPSAEKIPDSFPQDAKISSFFLYQLNQAFSRILETAPPQEAGEWTEAYLFLTKQIPGNVD